MAGNNIYPVTSPFYNTGVVNGKFLDVMINRTIPKLASDRYWTITSVYNQRPDLLAYDLYANAKLWWVFANRNPNTLMDPLFDFKTGVGIYLPENTTLTQVLGL